MERLYYDGTEIEMNQASEESLKPGQTVYTGETPDGVSPRASFRLLVGPTRMRKGVKKTMIQIKVYVDTDTSMGTQTTEITSNYTTIGPDTPDGNTLQLKVARAHMLGMLVGGQIEMVRRVKRNAIGCTPMSLENLQALSTAVGTTAS